MCLSVHIHQTFLFVAYKQAKQVRVSVNGKHLQPSVMIMGKAAEVECLFIEAPFHQSGFSSNVNRMHNFI
jgi:hypothetical protein